MSNNIWPKISKVMKHGKPMFMADARISGKGERRFFATRREAEGWAQLQRVKRQNEGGRAFHDGELSAYGWSVQDAIRFALDHLHRIRASVPLEQAISQFIETKQTTGRSERYCNDLRMRLGRLQRAFPDTTIARISTQDLEAFLSGMKVGAETRNTHRRDLRTLWNFAEKRGWALGVTATNTERAKAIEKPPGILGPEQVAALLTESHDPDLLALHSIGCFAGLRTVEIGALDWKDVDFAGGFIHVRAKISKTRSRRLVPILDNLRAWLQPIAKLSGPVLVDPDTRYRHEATRARAGIKVWPQNCMRHSFVSYRLAATQNAPQVALESGHDQAILFAHYRELVRPKDAERFFSIRPAGKDAGEKIVSISAA